MLRFLALIPLVWVLWRPVSGGNVLYPLLAVLALLSLMAARKPTRWLVGVAVLLLGCVLLMALVGSFNDAPRRSGCCGPTRSRCATSGSC